MDMRIRDVGDDDDDDLYKRETDVPLEVDPVEPCL
jgi:hypothetical protein